MANSFRFPPRRVGAFVQLLPALLATGLLAARATGAATASPTATPKPTAVAPAPPSTWPQGYQVSRTAHAGHLTLATPYYTIEHDLRRGGVIDRIALTHGRATNLLQQPLSARLELADGSIVTDLADGSPRITQRREGIAEIVEIETRLTHAGNSASTGRLRTTYEYRWGYVRIRQVYELPPAWTRVKSVTPVNVVLAANLTDYGYREGKGEENGAPAFSFGSNLWGRLRPGHPEDQPVTTPFPPRSVLLADPGVEGLEWFAGSELAQWETQLTGRRGQGRFRLARLPGTEGLALSIAALDTGADATAAAVTIPATLTFDYRLGLPLLEGHARRPWLHTSFNRNRGEWLTTAQIQELAAKGIQTLHCHNDGDYYGDGLFWRDGSYPPYPDMDKFDRVVTDSHAAGLRVATYFSNKELHPSTPEFQAHGTEWGRTDRQGRLQHNFFQGTNEFGVQMCLRSGWLDFLKSSIDRVVRNHRLDGVYYDWNVALACANPRHGAAGPGATAGHWDIDELLELMEWTRFRVGPSGLVIIHNTTTPMFATENFADDIVANEWGYGRWKEPGPALDELPLEWTLVGARSRGVISYGQLDAQSPRRLHQLFTLEALLGGVTPWPASPETFQLYPILAPLGDLTGWRFADWRSPALRLEGGRGGVAVYSRTGEAAVLVANFTAQAQTLRLRVDPRRLPVPMARVNAATCDSKPDLAVDVHALLGEGAPVTVPGDTAVLIRLR